MMDGVSTTCGVLQKIAAPAVDALDQTRAWEHLRLDLSGSPAVPFDKDLVDGLISTVSAHLDGPKGILGRALITQKWALLLNQFPRRGHCYSGRSDAITVPLPPLQTVDSVVYIDSAGVSQTLDTTKYTVLDRETLPSQIVPSFGNQWPTTQAVPNAVTVSFTAGYGDSPSDIDPPLTSAMLLLLSNLYDNRSAVIQGATFADNPTLNRLLGSYAVWI